MGTIAFTVFHTIVSPGNDSTGLYYAEGINIAKMISADFSNIKWIFMAGKDFDQTLLINPYNEGYFRSESNYFVTRLVAIFSFISLNNYMVINLFFSMISFSGVWKLYRFFMISTHIFIKNWPSQLYICQPLFSGVPVY